MPVQWSEDSFYMKEMSKWDRKKRDGGMNANGFERFPQMLYKAQLQPLSNTYEVAMKADVISADKTRVILSAEEFNLTCQLIVKDEREYEQARDNGWRDSQKEAMAYHESLQQDIARAAAESAHADRNMGQAAQAERRAHEDSTPGHVAEVPTKRQLSPEAKQRLRDNLAKARAAKAQRTTTKPAA